MQEEVWKPIPSLPEYEASSMGRLRRLPFYGQMPNGGERPYGGKITLGTLRKDSGRRAMVFKGKNYKVHRLVCEAFHGPQPSGCVAMHLDGNPLNNRADNLAWGTQKENLNHKDFLKYCKERRGENSRRVAAVSDSAAREIYNSTEPNVVLAQRYGIAPCTVSNIRSGRARRNATGAPYPA